MKRESKICHYLDIPVQHGSDRILKRMGRRTDSGEIRRIVEKLRENIPDICLRTTLITGFPGETEEDFGNLMDFVDEMEFDRLGVFTYSMEEDTPAAAMPDQLEEDIKEEWKEFLTDTLQEEGICDGLVCELGCGTGRMTRLLAQSGYDMIGIDVSEEMLRLLYS